MFTSREVHRLLIFTNTGPGSSGEHINVICALIWLMCQKFRTLLSCGQISCHGCPMPCTCTLPDSGPDLWKGTVQLFPCSTTSGQWSISLHWHSPKNDVSMVITLACFQSQASRGILSEVLSVKWWSVQQSLMKPKNKHKIWQMHENYPHKHRKDENKLAWNGR